MHGLHPGDRDGVSLLDQALLQRLRRGQGDGDPWAAAMPVPQVLDPGLVAEGHTIPVARVQAMHEGKRRAKARREAAGGSGPRADDGN